VQAGAPPAEDESLGVGVALVLDGAVDDGEPDGGAVGWHPLSTITAATASGMLRTVTRRFMPHILAETSSVEEVPLPGEVHGHACLLGSRDDLVVADRASWLDNRGRARFGGRE